MANSACTAKLQNQQWPIDCLVLLSTSAVKKDDSRYKNLNQWCKIYSLELLKKQPPKAIFSLYMPETCLNIAWQAKKHFTSKSILDGSFLNSFP